MRLETGPTGLFFDVDEEKMGEKKKEISKKESLA
jgi:hypothetical protein